MSYKKAMKHWNNIRKCKKQAANMYMGFDAGNGAFKETPAMAESRVLMGQIKSWFRERHEGNKQYNRECVREAIADYRALLKKSADTQALTVTKAV